MVMETIYREEAALLKKALKELWEHYEFVRGDLLSQIELNKQLAARINELEARS